jgi:protein-tyrosine phosphatase
MNILFVCLGNICRSPLAEAVFADLVRREGVADRIGGDSAGTAGYHAGEPADRRSRDCARRHGLEITHRARAVTEADFTNFDLLVAMDEANAADLRRRAPTPAARRKVRLMRDWDPAGPGEVPDPYYGTEEDFDHVWHLCDRAMPGLLAEVVAKEHRR